MERKTNSTATLGRNRLFRNFQETQFFPFLSSFYRPKYLTRLPTCQTTNTEAAAAIMITMVEGTHFVSPVADDHYKKTFELGLMKILLCVSSSYT